MNMRKYSVIGLLTAALASSAMAAATNTFQFGGVGNASDIDWDDSSLVIDVVGSITNYSVTGGVPARYAASAISNVTFTVTYSETNGIPVFADNWIGAGAGNETVDNRINSNEVIRLTVDYSDPNGKVTSLRVAGIAPFYNLFAWETTTFSDGVNSTGIVSSLNADIFDYDTMGLDQLSTANTATWEVLVAADDSLTPTLGGGTNFTETGMGAFVLEYIADVDDIPEYTALTPIHYEFEANSEFDVAGPGTTMTRSNSWDSLATITTVEIVGWDGTSATGGVNNVMNIWTSESALAIKSGDSAHFAPNQGRDFNPGEAWIITFDRDVYLETIDLDSCSTNTEMTVSSANIFTNKLFGLGVADTDDGGTFDLLDTFVPAGTHVKFEMTSTTNIADWGLRIDWLEVQVASDPETYYAWIQEEGLTSQLNDAYEDDPDADTVDNLAEFALGGDPLVDDAATILPVSGQSVDGGTNYLDYIYRRRLAADYAELTYLVGSATDLFHPVTNVTEEVGSAALDDDIESVTNRVPSDVEDKQFMQLEVTID